MHRLFVAVALGAAAWAGQAGAAVINYATSVTGTRTVFAGQPQESLLTFTGCPGFLCDTSVDLTAGTPASAITHGVSIFPVGDSVGFSGPSTTFDIGITYLIEGQSVTLDQSVRFSQIANGQFQFDAFDSATKTIDLGALGLLDITALAVAVQVTEFEGGGQLISTRFLLHDAAAAVPEPAAWAMLIAGFGLVGGALRTRRRAVALTA